MKSLYFKVLIWFLATVAVTGGGVLWVAALFTSDQSGSAPPFRRSMAVQFESARTAYESGGAEALRQHLDLIEKIAGIRPLLTDTKGRDLATGEDRSSIIRRFERRLLPRMAPIIHAGQPLSGMLSEDGRYWLFTSNAIGPGPGARRGPFALPSQLYLIASVGLLSFWLAYHVTAPVRNLQKAVEQFGAGDLSRRVEVTRSDEVGQLASAFNRMADRVEILVKSERRLLMDISHELRSPLTRLGLAVELGREGGDARAALDRVQREADRLNSLVGGLLQVTRGEADPSAIRFEEADVESLITTIVADTRIDAEAKNCEIRYTSVALVTDCDVELLRRAVENVLRNAIRHSPQGQLVELTLARHAGEAEVEVRDYGPGVPEHALPHLFEAFYRAEPTGGFGLGLSIAQRAMQLHRGTIVAENAGPGLRVRLRWPVS